MRVPHWLMTAILGLLLAAGGVHAQQNYPTKPIRVIIPWPPGGSSDIIGRLLAAELTTRFKQQVLIESRPGAGGIVGMQIATALPPDGYTFFKTSTAYGFLIDKPRPPVDLVNSFDPVVLIGLSDSALVVHPSLPVKSVRDLVALAKKRPGEMLYASSGIGTFPHLNTELLALMTGTRFVHVPYKGAAPAASDLVGGQTQFMIASLVSVYPFVQSNRLRLLALGRAQRSATLPEVPIIAETVPGYESRGWWGIFAPPKTPADIVARFHAETTQVISSPAFQKRLAEQGGEVVTMTSAEFGRLMASEQAKWQGVIAKAGIKGE